MPLLLLAALPAVAVATGRPRTVVPPDLARATGVDPVTGTAGIRVDTDGGVVHVRSGPATDRRVSAALGDDSRVAVRCKVWGERVTGTKRRTAYWMRVGAGRYLSDAFLDWPAARPEVPWCGNAPVDAVTARVAAGGSVLNLRREPGTGTGRLGTVDDGSVLAVRCQAAGQAVGGSGTWLRVAGGRYVAEAYVRWAPQRPWLPWCGQEPSRTPPASSREFLAQAAGPARAAARAHGVPASVLVAQAVYASDWGRAEPARRDHNLFGTLCVPAAQPGALGCREYGATALRAYRGPADSFADQARMLAAEPRNATALTHAADPERFVRDLQAAGYAGGAHYADRLVDLIRRYDLRRLDAAG
ncbi:sporangiospore maturation cell wall hydrolase GsmA [Catellatospora sp. IY07-71]|uniref:sporangiospore maturation cell wall hydrolase GsmA n=1 Tax=Catellatospora sp. IY07-71 TaxID=2728827 RepID=UPI001BB349D8|nr:sporangiospore maturation cell wall hydrolase GsmA [Catellatospora sp. IY07-71]